MDAVHRLDSVDAAGCDNGGMTHAPSIHASTAMFPGFSFAGAMERLAAGVSEPLFGEASLAHCQLCPQNPGHIDEAACELLVGKYPSTRFRLHANARVQRAHRLLDASTVSAATWDYYADLADRSRRLGARAYSLHAGFADNCDLSTMLDNVRRLQDLFGPDCIVAVEGLYPNAHRPQLMDTWDAYEAVMRAGVPMAIDLSHLNIVARKQRSRDEGLARDLVASASTIEIHLSANDGRSDQHSVLDASPWWWGLLKDANPAAVLFSEGNQVRDAAKAIAAVSTSGPPDATVASSH